MNESGQTALTSKLKQMKRQPFGKLEDGTTVDEINGKLLTGAIEYMLEWIAQEIDESPDTTPDNRSQKVQQAQADALVRLVEMLNAAIADDRFHVTADYIRDESNNYSTEFWLFTIDYCRVISGDPDFYANSSQGRIPPLIIALFRPLSIPTIYRLLPSIVSKFTRTDVRLVEITPTTATIRWYGHRQEDPILSEIHLAVASMTFKNLMSSIPPVIHDQPPAEIIETSSMLDGLAYYEWIFRWQIMPQKTHRWLVIGVLGGLAILIMYLWLGLPAELLLILAILAPVILGWSLSRFNRLAYDHSQNEILLQEQRNLAEEQYDQSQRAKAQLQSLNVDLNRKVDEFTALYEIGVAINATLDLDELIQKSLLAVTEYLHFDRAMVLLVDEDSQVLNQGHSVGGTAENDALVNNLEIPLDQSDHYFVDLFHADEPVLVQGINSEEMEPTNYQLAVSLGVEEHLGTPLISKGHRVGLLDVDNNLSKRPITDEDVELIFVVAGQIAVAIENALLYRQVEYQRQNLELRVEQRTRELARATAEAQQARAIAEEANEAKSTFLSNVSHELRTPLTAILGFNRIIHRSLERNILPNVQVSSPKVTRALNTIQESQQFIFDEGERLTLLINDVLDLAKIEAGKIDWEMQPLQIKPILEHAIASTTSLLEKNQLRLVQDIEDDLPEIIGDRNRLIQVVINLLSNAYKFTAAGTIRCRAWKDEEGITVSVKDEGIGIAAEDLPKVFAAFMQVGDTLSEKPAGTGLGLAITKEIIEHHGGRIWVESEPGQGSEFYFWLPVLTGSQQNLATVKLDALLDFLNSPPPADSDQEKCILIVDNEESIRRYLAEELILHNYQVLEAGSGREAVALVEANVPDFMIMDVLMPGMDGYQTLANLRRQPAMMSVPAIILSVVEETKKGYGLGIKAFMTKPIDAPSMLAKIEELLRTDRGSQSVIVVDDLPSRAADLTKALNDRGFLAMHSTDPSLELNGETADILLISAALFADNSLFDKPAIFNALANRLVLLYE